MCARFFWRNHHFTQLNSQMAKVKETTGIVGLDMVPNAREVLIGLYTKTLKEIQAVPEDEGYIVRPLRASQGTGLRFSRKSRIGKLSRSALAMVRLKSSSKRLRMITLSPAK